MKEKEMTEFLNNEQYNEDSENDTAKHWLSPLTGSLLTRLDY